MLIDADELLKRLRGRLDALKDEVDFAMDRHDYVDVHEFASRGCELDSAIQVIKKMPPFEPTAADCWGCNCPKMERLEPTERIEGSTLFVEVDDVEPILRVAVIEKGSVWGKVFYTVDEE